MSNAMLCDPKKVPYEQIGGYQLRRLIGQGSMGQVFEAVHRGMNQRAAVKIMRQSLCRQPQLRERFLNEARALCLVQHQGLVRVFDVGELPDHALYLMMEYLDGETLAERLQRGALAPSEAVRIGRQIASALCVAHEVGVVHRDLKPANVIIITEPEAPGGERAKILDFGVARMPTWQEGGAAERLTQEGAVLGTPLYMAPEQIQGRMDVDGRADVYALGVVLFQMLTGHVPFVGDNAQLWEYHLSRAPPRLRALNPRCSVSVDTLLQWMMTKAPEDRPRMAEVLAALQRLCLDPDATLHGPELCAPRLCAPQQSVPFRGRLPGVDALDPAQSQPACGEALRRESYARPWPALLPSTVVDFHSPQPPSAPSPTATRRPPSAAKAEDPAAGAVLATRLQWVAQAAVRVVGQAAARVDEPPTRSIAVGIGSWLPLLVLCSLGCAASVALLLPRAQGAQKQPLPSRPGSDKPGSDKSPVQPPVAPAPPVKSTPAVKPPTTKTRVVAPPKTRVVSPPKTGTEAPSNSSKDKEGKAPAEPDRRLSEVLHDPFLVKPVSPPPLTLEEAEAMLEKSKVAFAKEKYATAMERALAATPRLGSSAWRLFGAAACYAGDAQSAEKAHRHLNDNSRQYLVFVCMKRGLSLASYHVTKQER